MSILRHWELALVPFCYLLWQHHHRQRHLGKKKQNKKTSGREKEDRWEERMICLSGQQTAACQIPITISFPPGGQFKAFPFRFRFLFFSFFFFLVQIHHPTATSRETCPRVYSDTVPRCPGWAPRSLESGGTFHTAISSHTPIISCSQVVEKSCEPFSNLSQHRLKSFFFCFTSRSPSNLWRISMSPPQKICANLISLNQQQHIEYLFSFFFFFSQVVFIFKSVHKLCPVGFLNALVIIIRYYYRASLYLFALRIRWSIFKCCFPITKVCEVREGEPLPTSLLLPTKNIRQSIFEDCV